MEHPDLRLLCLGTERALAEQQRDLDLARRAHLSLNRGARPSRLATARAFVGNTLIALGTRIAPAPSAHPALAPGR